MKISFTAHLDDLSYMDTTLRILNQKGFINEDQLRKLFGNVSELQKLFGYAEKQLGKGYVEIDAQ